MSQTRNLGAILVADVVGYSRLTDEAGTARAVREHRDAARPLVATRDGPQFRGEPHVGDGPLPSGTRPSPRLFSGHVIANGSYTSTPAARLTSSPARHGGRRMGASQAARSSGRSHD